MSQTHQSNEQGGLLSLTDPRREYVFQCLSLLLHATNANALPALAWQYVSSTLLHQQFDRLPNEVIASLLERISYPQSPRAFRIDLGSKDPNTFDPVFSLFEVALKLSSQKSMGEHYTPLWLAYEVISRVPEFRGRVLDPSVGGGVFSLALANRLSHNNRNHQDFHFVGFERNPWSVFGAAANWAIANRRLGGPADRPIPIAWFDPLADAARSLGKRDAEFRSLGLAPGLDVHPNSRSLQPNVDSRGSIETAIDDPGASPRLQDGDPSLRGEEFGQFDAIVGNPPWVLWDNLAAEDLERIKLLARHYGLFAEKGMNSILGGGKKDLAMLFTLVAADKYLKPGGTLAFVMPQSAFKSTKSGRGFRRWRLPDGTPLKVVSVDDLSALQPFPSATTKTTILVMKKGEETSYPVDYYVWSAKPRGRKDKLAASPGDPNDSLSAWQCRAVAADRSEPFEGALGQCDYVAHLGVNTGGANGVYWFERLNESNPQTWSMRNLAERGKRKVASGPVEMESEYLYPIVLGNDVKPWIARPSAWILLVQDPDRRRGVEIDVLRSSAPLSFRYLQVHETMLRERAAFRRYFQRESAGKTADVAPFYSMFDVGPYVRSKFKVVWNRMGHRLGAAVIGESDGKPIQCQETHAYFPVDCESEAFYLTALLNSRLAQIAMNATAPVGGKSFATPGAIHRLRLPKFDPNGSVHAELAAAGQQASCEAAENGQPSAMTIDSIEHAARRIWMA